MTSRKGQSSRATLFGSFPARFKCGGQPPGFSLVGLPKNKVDAVDVVDTVDSRLTKEAERRGLGQICGPLGPIPAAYRRAPPQNFFREIIFLVRARARTLTAIDCFEGGRGGRFCRGSRPGPVG